MHRKLEKIPTFIELTKNGQRVFVPPHEYLHVPKFRRQVVGRAFIELRDWRDSFGRILERLRHKHGQEVVRAIDRLGRKLGRRWPKRDASAIRDA